MCWCSPTRGLCIIFESPLAPSSPLLCTLIRCFALLLFLKKLHRLQIFGNDGKDRIVLQSKNNFVGGGKQFDKIYIFNGKCSSQTFLNDKNVGYFSIESGKAKQISGGC